MKIVFLSLILAFIVPNNSPPWNSFQSEFLAIFFAISIGFMNFRKKTKFYSYDLFLIAILVAAGAGYFFKVGAFSAYLYVGIVYLFSALIAFHTAIENKHGDSYFEWFSLSVILASIISLGCQLVQLMNLEGYFFPWVSDNPAGGRYFGNLGQPNQLASLVLMSFLCGLYLSSKEKISRYTQIVLAIIFGFSLSLAGSKTSIVSLISAILLLLFVKERKYSGYAVLCGLSFLFFSVFIKDEVRDYGGGDISTGRFSMWGMLIDSVFYKPWIGYGFNDTAIANFELINEFPVNWNRFTAHSHNIVLDFFVWFGIPVGIFLTIFFSYLCWQHLFLQKKTQDKLIAYTAIPLLVHSMLEFPLHYAYFLIPISFIMGSCWKGKSFSSRIYLNQIFIICCLPIGILMTREYLILESSLTEQRFYINNFSNGKEQEIIFPKFLDLPTSQFNFLVKNEITQEDYFEMENLVRNYPTYRNFHFLCDYLLKKGEYKKFLLYYEKALALLNKEEAGVFKNSFEIKKKLD
ncbi:O-antigen ligase family protein [Comamonas thiooxydans]|uniref:O-antigen ligase family protein n=1 Tax=Comamonas thiooxydans TaxID=363952 RepID=UPI0009EDDF83|nr:O-antigen ligase family protein [Comamonas thiooxydans]